MVPRLAGAGADLASVPPVHGVPVSLKDQIDVEGHDTTMGFTYKRRQPMAQDAPLVALIRKVSWRCASLRSDALPQVVSDRRLHSQAGGIPFVKTAIPQTMLSFECSTPLFGVAKNPYDPRRTPGGSSGGEGALLGSDASVIGIGSDMCAMLSSADPPSRLLANNSPSAAAAPSESRLTFLAVSP